MSTNQLADPPLAEAEQTMPMQEHIEAHDDWLTEEGREECQEEFDIFARRVFGDVQMISVAAIIEGL